MKGKVFSDLKFSSMFEVVKSDIRAHCRMKGIRGDIRIFVQEEKELFIVLLPFSLRNLVMVHKVNDYLILKAPIFVSMQVGFYLSRPKNYQEMYKL